MMNTPQAQAKREPSEPRPEPLRLGKGFKGRGKDLDGEDLAAPLGKGERFHVISGVFGQAIEEKAPFGAPPKTF